jgi:hypothetical protein
LREAIKASSFEEAYNVTRLAALTMAGARSR